MTTPKVATVRRGDSRFYVNPETDAKVPGVTSILNVLPKPFLVAWAAKETAKFAVRNLAAVKSLVDAGESEMAVSMLKDARWAETRKASNMGDVVHDAFERMAGGESGASILADAEDPAALEPYVRHFEAFLDEFQPEYLFMEETVWSDSHRYAGSFDGLAKIQGETVWLDTKTTRSGVHAEVALQLAAYGHADFILRGDGSKVPLPKGTGAATLLVRPYGWSLQPVAYGPEVFADFLTLRETFEVLDRLGGFIGKPLNAKPITTPAGRLTAAAERAQIALAKG